MPKLSLTLALLPLFGLGLGCPDPGARFDEFLDASDENATNEDANDENATDEDSETGPTPDVGIDTEDISGVYLLALETKLGPGLPLLFVTTVDDWFSIEASATFTFQPLDLEHEFVGDPLVFPDVEVDANGEFVLDMGIVMVVGEANPITQSPITASLVLLGHVVNADTFCGDITGQLMSPLEYDLAGSTFAAIRLADDGSNPATLPGMFPSKC